MNWEMMGRRGQQETRLLRGGQLKNCNNFVFFWLELWCFEARIVATSSNWTGLFATDTRGPPLVAKLWTSSPKDNTHMSPQIVGALERKTYEQKHIKHHKTYTHSFVRSVSGMIVL